MSHILFNEFFVRRKDFVQRRHDGYGETLMDAKSGADSTV